LFVVQNAVFTLNAGKFKLAFILSILYEASA